MDGNYLRSTVNTSTAIFLAHPAAFAFLIFQVYAYNTITCSTAHQFSMKLTALTLLSNSAILALTAVTPSPNTAYQLKVLSQTPALKDTVLTVKDDSSANAFPIPLGVFSTGEPRAPYKFTFSPSTAGEGLYELKGTLRQTHLIITGDPRAMGFFEAPIGGDPQPAANETQFTNKWMVFSSGDGMNLVFAEGLAAGSWRACKGDSELDYTFYFFDGKQKQFLLIRSMLMTSREVGAQRHHQRLRKRQPPGRGSHIQPDYSHWRGRTNRYQWDLYYWCSFPFRKYDWGLAFWGYCPCGYFP